MIKLLTIKLLQALYSVYNNNWTWNIHGSFQWCQSWWGGAQDDLIKILFGWGQVATDLSLFICSYLWTSIFKQLKRLKLTPIFRPGSRLAHNQWETALQSTAISHWLGANLESALNNACWIQKREPPRHAPLPRCQGSQHTKAAHSVQVCEIPGACTASWNLTPGSCDWQVTERAN